MDMLTSGSWRRIGLLRKGRAPRWLAWVLLVLVALPMEGASQEPPWLVVEGPLRFELTPGVGNVFYLRLSLSPEAGAPPLSVVVADVAFGQVHERELLEAVQAKVMNRPRMEGPFRQVEEVRLEVVPRTLLVPGSYFVTLELRRGRSSRRLTVELVRPEPRFAFERLVLPTVREGLLWRYSASATRVPLEAGFAVDPRVAALRIESDSDPARPGLDAESQAALEPFIRERLSKPLARVAVAVYPPGSAEGAQLRLRLERTPRWGAWGVLFSMLLALNLYFELGSGRARGNPLERAFQRALRGGNREAMARLRAVLAAAPWAQLAELPGPRWLIAACRAFSLSSLTLLAGHVLYSVFSGWVLRRDLLTWGAIVCGVGLVGYSVAWERSRRRVSRVVSAASERVPVDELVRIAFPELGERVIEILGRRVEFRLEAVRAGAVPHQRLGFGHPMRQGGLYRLVMRIHGRRDRAVKEAAGARADADEALAADPTVGQRLEMVVFPVDFEVVSERIQPVTLPYVGPTPEVDFFLRAPSRTGLARARIGVFHNDQILQSFLLRTEIEPRPDKESHPEKESRPDHGPSAPGGDGAGENLLPEPELAQTQSFLDVERMPGRGVSIGINSHQGTHTLTFKKGNYADSFTVAEEEVTKAASTVRTQLQRITVEKPKNPNALLCQLIRDAHELHRRFYKRSKMQSDDLATMTASEGEIIQIIRYVADHAFPWALMYDFQLPEDEADGAVCRGYMGALEALKPCAHSRMSRAYCLRGFWGIRHQVEQLIAGIQNPDVQGPITGNTIQVVVGEFSGSTDAEKKLLDSLKQSIRAPAIESPGTNASLLDVLFDQKTRPATLVLLGHLETRKQAQGPKPPYIPLAPGKALSLAAFDDRMMDREWKEPPNPLVLLLTCSSAALGIRELESFALSAYKARASAVIGTECSLFASLGARFAAEFLPEFCEKHSTVGEALMEFRRRLARDGNPLGLVFTLLGRADMKLKPGGKA